MQYTMPTFRFKKNQSIVFFEKDLAQLEVLRVTHAGDQLLRLVAEQITFLSLFKQILH